MPNGDAAVNSPAKLAPGRFP